MIIKCPECGHQVSDKAPVCPSCGVEIAGHLIKCSHCGETYLKEEGICPNCHHSEAVSQKSFIESLPKDSRQEDGEEQVVEESEQPINTTSEIGSNPAMTDSSSYEPVVSMEVDIDNDEPIAIAEPILAETDMPLDIPEEEKKKNNHVALLVSFLIALIISIVLVFFYKQGTTSRNSENDDFIAAIESKDPQVLQKFLTDYPNAPIAHTDSVKACLVRLKRNNEAWATVLATNSREAYVSYLASHPNSPHKSEIEKRLDELDWAEATAKNTEESYLGYKEREPKGAHNKEADELLKKLLDHTASAEDQATAINAIRQLLVGMNTKNKQKIAGAVASSFSFLGSTGATASNIEEYMRNRLYQADVKTINWHLGTADEVTTEKSDESGAEQHVAIPATLEIQREGGTSRKQYQLHAVVKEGKIISINWTAK